MDLRNIAAASFNLGRLIRELRAADLIVATFEDGGGHVCKGRDRLERIVQGGRAEECRVLSLTIANTTQAELVMALIATIETGSPIDRDRVLQMLEVSSTLAGGFDHDRRFDEAMRRRDH